MILELRSDTFTKPTSGMLEAMFSAQVGDDVFEEDPTTIALEQKAAGMFGYEAGLLCVSGTMANQIAIHVHTRPGDEVICDQLSHIYLYEGGGIAANSLASVQLLNGDRGRITARQVAESIKTDNVHYTVSRLVSIENTMNKGGGAIYDLQEIQKIRAVCNENALAMHMDGARIFNALVETGESPSQYGSCFDSISLCLSKGLGAPLGTVLLGSKAFVKQARRVRKRFGGGWRQSGYMAAAGIYALDHHIDRLKEDHQRARAIASMLKKMPQVEEIMPIDTNILMFRLNERILSDDFVARLEKLDIRCAPFGKHQVRMVTHLNFGDNELEIFEKKMNQV